MTIKSSGSSLSFTEIKAEFGNPTNNKFGSYRVSQTIGSLKKLPLDTGIPSSGPIKFSQFYDKELNIVVKCEGGNRATASWSDGVVVGGFKKKPGRNDTAWQGGKRVFINITGTYSSNGASSSEWAFKTGNSWPDETKMSVVISSDGQVVGRGGNGGSQSGGNGGNGSNALRVWSGYEAFNNAGYISGGGGGGGGGGHAEQNDWGDKNDAEGGGGGGGNGLPAGSGGSGNEATSSQDGELTKGGAGKDGENDSEAVGGNGGNGGSRNEDFPYNAYDGVNATGGKNKEEANGNGGEGGKGVESY